MRVILRTLAVILAAGFACTAYVYLTLPDVRALRTKNLGTTAFMELRVEEAWARGAKRYVLGPVLRRKSLQPLLAGANHFGTLEALSERPRRR